MTYESLIFDIDGTLWDSRPLVAAGYNAQLEKEGLSHLKVTAEQLTTLFGKTTVEIGDILYGSLPQEERLPLMERCMASQDVYVETYGSEALGYPGVAKTLAALHKTYRLFIVSNSQKGYPDQCIAMLGLTPYIQGHLCYGETGTSKGQSILTLMKQYGIENCAYVGDTQGDYEATQEAGIPFIWASYGFGTPEGYAARIDSIEELLKL